jgi:hypothetical protein
LRITKRICHIKYPFAPAEVVEFFRTYFGPVKNAFAAVGAGREDELRRDLERVWSEHNRAEDKTTDVEVEYLEVIASKS